jgi:hypothetical protein
VELECATEGESVWRKRRGRLIYHCIRSRTGGQDVDDIFQTFFECLMKTVFALQLWQRRSAATDSANWPE